MGIRSKVVMEGIRLPFALDIYVTYVLATTRYRWQPLFRVDGSVSRYTYWATTCGVGEYQYHHDDAPVAPELLDGDLLGLVKSTLKRYGVASVL